MQNKISKKLIISLTLFAVFVTSIGFCANILANEKPVDNPYELTIVLDAGHGGLDVK